MTFLDVGYGILIGFIISLYFFQIDQYDEDYKNAKTMPEDLNEFSLDEDSDIEDYEQKEDDIEKKDHPKEIEMNEKEALRQRKQAEDKKQNEEKFSDVELNN